MTDALDQNVGGINTDNPRLSGTFECKIQNPSVGPNSNGDGDVMTIPMVLTEEATATNGEVLHPGFPQKTWIGLTAKQNRTDGQIAKDLAVAAKAAQLDPSTTPRDLITDPMLLHDRVVKVKIAVQKKNPDFDNVRFVIES